MRAGETVRIAEFDDPRLVAIYDTVNPYAPDAQPGFYLRLADELGASSLVDVGCGTGLITCALARPDRRVVGVDPAPRMLDIARRRACGGPVHWVCGDAGCLHAVDADLAIMTGHVAQFLVADRSWSAALTALHDALRPGGRLAFETRNPAAREWESWTRESSRRVVDPVAGRVETWSEVHDVQGGIVSSTNHHLFAATGEDVISPYRLRFRTEAELCRTLTGAGFTVERMYGDWGRRACGPTSRELIVVARA